MPFKSIVRILKGVALSSLHKMGYALIKLPTDETAQISSDFSPRPENDSSEAPATSLPHQQVTTQEKETVERIAVSEEDRSSPVYLVRSDAQPHSLTELLDALEACAGPVAQGRKVLVWPFERTGSTGHLAMEPFYIKSIYAGVFDEIVVVTRQRHSCHNSNTEIFDVALAGMKVACTDDQRLLDLSSYEIGLIERGPYVFLLHSYAHISRAFFRHCLAGGTKAFFQLTDSQQERERKLLRAAGLPKDAKWIVAHARESGFHPRSYDNYRCTNIERYFDSIRALTRQGYFVVRIGDPSMKRLPDFGRQVIDLPFVKHYDFAMDVLAIARCEFMISAHSGPCMLARAFDRPCLAVNVPLTFAHIPGERDMIAWRRYHRGSSGGPVTPLSYQSLIDTYFETAFEPPELNGIEFSDLSSQEVATIVREMEDRVRDPSHPLPTAQDRFMAINRAADERASATPPLQRKRYDHYGCAKPGTAVPDAYCEINPGYL